ncbi:MBL fold metallo-hydrolase [Xenorhabdus bovienii]|uniref:MBL fold metallo-hydrolase n=2 Tax=Xenorhabdus bovienii TaxID=40576 RepID=A0AAJ1JFT3_XENBV|nr:MBL fold metallo-hydrolase [Xenorhabdus bovienii]MDE1480273.1 MBL fold metallo-hydrolase [Xenorhabdus bovienii]MDE9511943.1 MBL fold metallo-hydrolase [Xenorhabdus bovienii]MDE9523585.1 MBL fold metallo-hydrolase [Xenorhabdus bovienii]
MLKIRMHKADNGDCVSIETESEFILIDGGTAQSFDNWKEQIVGQVDKIDSLIVTHIDNDHVNGIIKLLIHPECPSIEQVYFNGAEQLFGQLAEDGQVDQRADVKLQALSEECSDVGDKEPIGYSEGTSLSYVISSNGIKCNDVVDGEALYREKCEGFDIGSLKFTLIGPVHSSLSELKRIWEDKLEERNIRPRIISKSYYDAFEQYASNVREPVPNNHEISSTEQSSIQALANTPFDDDDSPTNRSSFSFLIESDGKRILYLGDCHSEVVTSWLDQQELEKIKVDVVKISHHGSQNNTSLELLRLIECNKYLISTNGKSHGHPNLETLARIALVNADFETEIFLNYELETIPDWFVTELNASYPSIKLLMNSCEVEL